MENQETLTDICEELRSGEYAPLADRIEAAWKRECEALMPQPDPDWKAICEKCHDGDILPDCEYFGEPNGCNSPIYGEHPKAKPVGDAAAMREALELLNQLFDSRVLGTHSEMTANEMDKVDELYFKTKAALAKPPRVCDVNTLESLSDFVERIILTSDLLKDTHEIVKSIVVASVRTALTIAYEPAKEMKAKEGDVHA